MKSLSPAQKKVSWVGLALILALIVVAVANDLHGSAQKITSFAECIKAGYPVTESSPQVCRAENKTFVGPTSSAEQTINAQASTNIVFQHLVSGDSRGKYPKNQEIILSQDQWVAYWAKVHAWLPSIPPLIPVDFSKQIVAAVNEGPQTTGGYGLSITGIQAFATETVVDVHESLPNDTCKMIKATSNSYNIVAFARPSNHTKFFITTTKRDC